MEKELLAKYKMQSREEMVTFLKSLWAEKPSACPLCGGKLDYFHKKAKKSNSDWVCTACGERFQAIDILSRINE